MKTLFVSSEIYPFAKLGGLGDVAHALPKALLENDIDARLMLPGYPEVIENLECTRTMAAPGNLFGLETARILLGRLTQGLMAYVIDAPQLYDRQGLYYDEKGRDWPDNHLRFGALGYIAANLEIIDRTWIPDIVHGQDWLCGLMPAYVKAKRALRPRTVLTIHNLAYQGLFPAILYSQLGLPQEFYAMEGVEFHGQVGFLKAGIFYADSLVAVSPTYALEIQQAEYGCGLDGLLRHRARDLHGILNGIDMQIWDPAQDPHLPVHYSAAKIENKAKIRAALLEELQLAIGNDVPVFGVVSRLAPQKGLDLLPEAMVKALRDGAGLAILGKGDAALAEQLQRMTSQWPGQVAVRHEYNEALAHRIIAGSDAILVPSRFEPCGLVQIYAMRYGTLPVVRRTGGLADTVCGEGPDATGFAFADATAADLESALQRVCSVFRKPEIWRRMQKNAMGTDFSWRESAKQYRVLYQELLTDRHTQRLSA